MRRNSTVLSPGVGQCELGIGGYIRFVTIVRQAATHTHRQTEYKVSTSIQLLAERGRRPCEILSPAHRITHLLLIKLIINGDMLVINKLCSMNFNKPLFCSLAVLYPRVGHTMDVYFRHLSLSSVSLIDFSKGSPVHDLMLSV